MTISERCAPTVGEFPAKVYKLVAQYQAQSQVPEADSSEAKSPEDL